LTDGLTEKIARALKDGPISRRKLHKDVFDFEYSDVTLKEAFENLEKAGKARRFFNWPLPGEERAEIWTLTPLARPGPTPRRPSRASQ